VSRLLYTLDDFGQLTILETQPATEP